MQMNQTQRKVITHGEPTKVKRFALTQTAHTVRLLTDTYSDPIRSIVREYLSNIIDAYTKMPKDRAFIKPILQLPTRFDQTIKFIDFGVGMSHDEVWEVFPSIGDSTKRDNNDEIGGFGLGAKSAFAYEPAENWTVEARYNGERMLFNAYYDKMGWPNFAHVTTEPTKEPNGVTISIPVATEDVPAFKKAAAEVLEFFPIEIEVKGDAEFNVVKREAIFAGTGWALNGNSSSRVIVGPIAYPVTDAELAGGDKLLTSLLAHNSLDIFVPIGSVDIVPNREQLIFRTKTRRAIQQVVKVMEQELPIEIAKLMDGARTEYEALQNLKEAWDIRALQPFVKALKFNGRLLTPDRGVALNILELAREFPELKVMRYDVAMRRRRSQYGKADWKHMETNDQADPHIYIDPYKDEYAIINDLPASRGIVGRLKLEQKNFYNDRRHGWATPLSMILFEKLPISTDDLSKRWGGAPVKPATQLPELPKAEKDDEPRGKTMVREYNYNAWTQVEADPMQPAVFIRTEKGEPKDYAGFHKVEQLYRKGLNSGQIPAGTPLYSIPRTLARKEKNTVWVELTDMVTKGMRDKVRELAAFHAERRAIEGIAKKYGPLTHFFQAVKPDDFKQNTLPRRISERLDAAIKANANVINKHTISLAEELGMEIPKRKVKGDPDGMFRQLTERYPMLNLCEGYSLSGHTKEVVDYLNNR
jgi:hypothetical protein